MPRYRRKPLCIKCHHRIHTKDGICTHREHGILCECPGYAPSGHIKIEYPAHPMM